MLSVQGTARTGLLLSGRCLLHLLGLKNVGDLKDPIWGEINKHRQNASYRHMGVYLKEQELGWLLKVAGL